MRFDYRAFIKFGGLSGTGWLLDLAILTSLVHFGIPAMLSNFISSSTAALTVFLVSRYIVFQPGQGGLGRRVLFYFLYTLVVITLASIALSLVLAGLSEAVRLMDIQISRPLLAAIAKVVITPPQLLMNFFVARHTAEKQIAQARRDA